MRCIKKFNTNRNINFIEPLKNLIRNLCVSEHDIDTVYTFKSRSKFPAVGVEDCLYVDLSDNMQVYCYDKDLGYMIFNNHIDEIQG
jgi:hypothetical protein